MRSYLLSFSFIFFLSFTLNAQYSIQSTVLDAGAGDKIEGANVRLLNFPDSSFVQAAQTNKLGSFKLDKVKQGQYLIQIKFLGYNDYFQIVAIENENVVIKDIQLIPDSKVLSEVEVTGTAAQMVVKGDTLEFNASTFKTGENAVVEELLKRLPGVEITTDGKIKVNGETVSKIRVDGKKFFEGDPEMATKNIPANLVDKVQVIEEKSEMAKLTGFEDDDTERIINLTLKASKRRGQFGNVSGGIGLDTENNIKYDGNVFLNIMEGESQTAITGATNNINNARSTRGRGSFNQNTGINESQSLGINNNSIINSKLKTGGDVSYSHSTNETISETNRESYLSESIYNRNTNLNSFTNNHALNARLELEWKPDTLTTWVFQPNINYNYYTSDSNNQTDYFTNSSITTQSNTTNNGERGSFGGGLTIMYSRKFASKPGRSLTARISGDLTNSDGNSYNKSIRQIIGVVGDSIIDQNTKEKSNQYSFEARISYVEPLWNQRNLLEVTASLRNNKNISEKNQFKYNNLTNDYDIKDLEYSNNFKNTFYRESFELNYQHIAQTYKITVGGKAEPSQTYSYREYLDGRNITIPNEVFNFSPSARFQYNFSKRKYLRLDYRGYTRQPSISQMQPVKNNSNLMVETVGNPELNPQFDQSLRAMVSIYNEKTFSSFTAYVRAGITKDALVTNSIYDKSGKEYRQTVNADITPYNFDGNLMFSTPIIQKRLHFTTNTSGSFYQRYGYSERLNSNTELDVDDLPLGNKGGTQEFRVNEQLSLSFTHDVIELSARATYRYGYSSNELSNRVTNTQDWIATGNLVLNLPYKFTLSSDLNYVTRKGYENFDSNDQILWNVSLEKSILKNKGVISFVATDLLREQQNVRQTVGDNYMEFASYNTLTSYFLVKFSYKINRFSGMKQSDTKDLDRNPQQNMQYDGRPTRPQGDAPRGESPYQRR